VLEALFVIAIALAVLGAAIELNRSAGPRQRLL
jgi:hypothetical protein